VRREAGSRVRKTPEEEELMDFKRLIARGRKVVDDRGGVDALKADAKELRDVAKGEGTLSDKAKAAAAALKDEGAKGDDAPEGQAEPAAGQAPGQPATATTDPPAAS
jgi:hypothetical protein